MIVSASALKRHCGHSRAINREVPKTATQQAACDLGTLFHSAVELWAKGGRIPDVNNEEVRGWLEILAMQWQPRPGMEFEIAIGVSPAGSYVGVDEPQPHVYVSRDPSQPLLTAGRADVAWLEVRSSLRIARLRDWKSGKYPSESADTNLQLHSLGIGLADKLGADAYQVELYYTRDGYVDQSCIIPIDSNEAADRWADVLRAALLDETPRPGPHCGDCWDGRLRRCAHAQKGAA